MRLTNTYAFYVSSSVIDTTNKGMNDSEFLFQRISVFESSFHPEPLESHALRCSVLTAKCLKLELCLLAFTTSSTKHYGSRSISHYIFCVTFSDLSLFPCSRDLHFLAWKQFSNAKIYVLSYSTTSII